MDKNIKIFLALDIIMLFVLIGFSKMIFEISGWKFILEFFILAAIIIGVLISLLLIYGEVRVGFFALAILLTVVLLNLLAIFYRTRIVDMTFFLTTVFAAVGFVLAVINSGEEKEIHEESETFTDIEELAPLEKKFEPGKFIASSTSSYYHAPKCDWAKKIMNEKQVWLNSEEEAEGRGLKPHSCLK